MKKWEYLALDLFPKAVRHGSQDESRYRCRIIDDQQLFFHVEGKMVEKPLLEWLNEIGEEGWEIVSHTPSHTRPNLYGGRYTFKRESSGKKTPLDSV